MKKGRYERLLCLVLSFAVLLTVTGCGDITKSSSKEAEIRNQEEASAGSDRTPNTGKDAKSRNHETSSAEWKFYRKLTTEMSDDGWCYYFEVEDSKDPDKSPDRIVYSFGAVNLRYNYDPDYVISEVREGTGGKKYLEVYATGAIRLGYGSAAEKEDLETIYSLLREKRPEEEMLKLTVDDLKLSVIDPSLFLRLMKKTILKEPHVATNKPAYADMPSQGFLVEPSYMDGYKFQMNFIKCMGYFEEVFIDVRYPSGEGYADYEQLSDLIDNGHATEEQIQLWNPIETITEAIKGSDDLLQDAEAYQNAEIAEVSLSRLYAIFESLINFTYSDYFPPTDTIVFEEIS